MERPATDLEARLAALEAQVAQQKAEISRLRRCTRLSVQPWLLVVVAVLAVFVGGGVINATPPDPKGGAGPVAVGATGQPVLIGQGNAPSVPTPGTSASVTSIFNPSTIDLMDRTLRVANYSDGDIGSSYVSGFRTAIVGTTSGSDSATGKTRVGVMGLADPSGNGVHGVSSTGNGVMGVSASGQGVLGATSSGAGVYGSSISGYGGMFAGGTAQLRLMPGLTAGAPVGGSHLMGELYLDSTGNLFLCTKASPGAFWVKLNLSPSYLPAVMR
jgi:hypothetical protein